MEKNAFVFYETFEESLKELPDELQFKFYKAIINYGLHGIEPDFTGLEKAVWVPIKFAIDEAQDRREKNRANGKKGGHSKVQEEEMEENVASNCLSESKRNEATLSETKRPEATLSDPNLNINVKENVNVNINANGNVVKDTSPQAEPAKQHTRFVKPSVPEISSYCFERKNGIDAQRFFDYYEARGWLIGKTHMKDWKAAVRTWENKTNPIPQVANALPEDKLIF